MSKLKKKKTVEVEISLLTEIDTCLNNCMFTISVYLPDVAERLSKAMLEIEKICPEAKKARLKDNKI